MVQYFIMLFTFVLASLITFITGHISFFNESLVMSDDCSYESYSVLLSDIDEIEKLLIDCCLPFTGTVLFRKIIFLIFI